jgi:tRNA (guanine37-N1)-methyltransferase
MRFDIITIFPKAFSYLEESIIRRAVNAGVIEIHLHDLRSFAKDKHKKVDDRPYGGGPGMVMKVEPIWLAVSSILKKTARHKNWKRRIILLSAKGGTFSQKKAVQLSKFDHIIFICGHYEGVDERVADHIADEEISIGNYVLTGGELPAMVILDAVARNIKGTIKKESLLNESFGNGKDTKLEHPQYTRPEVFSPVIKGKKAGKSAKKWSVPAVLLSGNTAKIEDWKKIHRKTML